jgi:hypothetical protein
MSRKMICISRKICAKCKKATLHEGYVHQDKKNLVYEYECLSCGEKSVIISDKIKE